MAIYFSKQKIKNFKGYSLKIKPNVVKTYYVIKQFNELISI